MRALRSLLSRLLAAALVAAGAAPSCSDPVHDSLVASLGPELPGVPQGPYHRAGQPCTVCHGPEGPAKTEFALAGTVFWQPFTASAVGADQAAVSVVDSFGAQKTMQTNCVGNFWVKPADYTPAFPILVSVFKDGTKYSQAMFTQISRATSCATCHQEPGANYDSVGQIYLTTQGIPPEEVPNATCPVNPNLAGGALH